MSLSELKESIEQDARSQKAAQLEAASKEASALIIEAKKRIKMQTEKKKAELDIKLDVELKKAVSQAQFDSKKELLNRKREIMLQTKETALNHMINLPDDEKKKWLNGLLNKASSQIQVARVLVNSKDQKLISSIHAIPADILGGLIAENKDSSIRIDFSLDSLMETISQDSLAELAELIFQ